MNSARFSRDSAPFRGDRGIKADRYRTYLLVAAIVMTVWGIVGFFDAGRFGRGGYVYSPTYVVEGIERGGAADQAGLREGDRVIMVGGIPVEDLPLYSRWPRGFAPRPGDAFPLEVERLGETLAVEIVYEPPTRSNATLRLGAAIIGLSFMGSGLWALFSVGTRYALLLAWIGLAAGATTFGKGPYLGTWDGLAMHIQFLATILWSLLMLRFFITFPWPKRIAENRVVTGIMYGACLLFVPVLALELLLHPKLYHSFGGPGALLIVTFSLLAVMALVHTLTTTRRDRLKESGMGLITLGILVAVLPNLLSMLSGMLLPDLELPGSSYLPLLIVAIPIAMAMAVRRHSRRVE